jgi:GT2 family glycosyltransferase
VPASRLPNRFRVLAVIPVYGHEEMTHDLINDLARESWLCDAAVVDNKGDYRPVGHERVIEPGRNLGWAGGTNHGVAVAGAGYGYYMWLNNDTRLSRGFVRSLLEAQLVTRAGVLAPFYNCHWMHQRDLSLPAVESYRPARKHYSAPFVDGTCMFVPAATVRRIGLLDDQTFAPLGWGAEIDYCLRARQLGHRVVVTRQAFLHHLRAVTAMSVFEGDYSQYVDAAHPTSLRGLEANWGSDWHERAGIDPVSFQTRPTDEGRRIRPVPLSGSRPAMRMKAQFRQLRPSA